MMKAGIPIFSSVKSFFEENLGVAEILEPPVIRHKGYDRAEAEDQNQQDQYDDCQADFHSVFAFTFVFTHCFS